MIDCGRQLGCTDAGPVLEPAVGRVGEDDVAGGGEDEVVG